jgi:ATP-dependent Lon protease
MKHHRDVREPGRFPRRAEVQVRLAEEEDQVGVVTGLAYTSVGGELLNIEALRLPGKGRMKTTGKLGDVMKESIDAASSYVRSIAPSWGSSRRASRSGTSTCTCPKAPRPRTGRRRVWPW